MSSKIDVVKFTFRKEWRALSDALSGKYEAEEFSTATDLVSYLSTQPASLIFSSLSEKDDLVQLATLVKIAKKAAKDTILKIVVVNFSGNKQFEKAIAKLGILDVVDPFINNKALRFKIDFYMKSLNGQMKNASGKSALNVKSIDQNGKAQEAKRTDAANWLPPMECEDDIWLLKKESDCKKVLGRWLLRFMAPSPAVCQWVELKGKSNAWKLEFKGEEKDLFVSGKGTWYFQGDQKPDFVWKENSWLVTGSSFELFYHEDGVKKSRAKLKDKILEVCKNSLYAQTKEQAILETCDKELVFKKEADRLAGTDEVDGENGTDFLSNLEGKGSTDHIDGDPLEGKNDPNADRLNNDPMSGKAGKADDLGGHYEGDGSTDQIENGGMEGAAGDRHRDGAQLGMKNTGNEHKTHYKGHNEAEEFEEGELGKSRYQEAALGGNYGGGSETDHIPKFYNKDGTKPDRPLSPDEQAEADAYEGRSNTDKLSKHYGTGDSTSSGESKDRPAAKKNEKNGNGPRGSSDEPEFDDEIGGDPYGGASNTDKLKSHYGSKSKNEKEDRDALEDLDKVWGEPDRKSKKDRESAKKHSASNDDFEMDEDDDGDLSGGSSTDKLSTHYGTGGKKSRISEDDLFEDEDENQVIASESGSRKKERRSSDKDDIFSRSHEDSDEFSAEDELESDDIYSQAEKKKKRSQGESALDDDFYEKIKQEKRRRGGHRDAENDDYDSSRSDEDFEDDNVVSLSKAREAKRKVAPLVSEDEIDPTLKTMMEEATITAILHQGDKKISCVLDDFFEQSLILISHKSGFNTHDGVKLELSFDYMKKVTNLSLEGKIQSIDFVENNMSYLTIEVDDKAAASFEDFMSLYQQRQENIDAFMKKAKGL